jgi:hypothetical protein
MSISNDFKEVNVSCSEDDGYIDSCKQAPSNREALVYVIKRNGASASGKAREFNYDEPHVCESSPQNVHLWKYIE